MLKIKADSLKAALLIAPKKDVRYYLNGVQILVKAEGFVHVRSTFGGVLFDDRMPELATCEPISIIVPYETVKTVCGMKLPFYELNKLADGFYELAGLRFKPVDGVFPDCDRVIPARVETDGAMQFDCELLALAQKAMRTATGRAKGFFKLQHTNPALMSCNVDFPRMVVMPLNPNAFK